MLSDHAEKFWDITSGACSMVITCECNITHFDETGASDGDYDEGEKELLLKRMFSDPEKYQGHDGFAHWCCLDGKTFVYGCDGCQIRMDRYESFIWSNRRIIMMYLKARHSLELAALGPEPEVLEEPAQKV